MDPLSDPQRQAIENEILAGRKIGAIKLYREATQTELVEAKRAIEDLEVDLRRRCPEKFVDGDRKAGCLGVLVTVALLAAGAILLAIHLRSS